MIELGRSREWLATADPHDIEAARWRLYSTALKDMATTPFAEMRESAEIDMIENPKSRARRATAFNRRHIENLTQAQIAKASVRRVLLLDDDDGE